MHISLEITMKSAFSTTLTAVANMHILLRHHYLIGTLLLIHNSLGENLPQIPCGTQQCDLRYAYCDRVTDTCTREGECDILCNDPKNKLGCKNNCGGVYVWQFCQDREKELNGQIKELGQKLKDSRTGGQVEQTEHGLFHVQFDILHVVLILISVTQFVIILLYVLNKCGLLCPKTKQSAGNQQHRHLNGRHRQADDPRNGENGELMRGQAANEAQGIPAGDNAADSEQAMVYDAREAMRAHQPSQESCPSTGEGVNMAMLISGKSTPRNMTYNSRQPLLQSSVSGPSTQGDPDATPAIRVAKV